MFKVNNLTPNQQRGRCHNPKLGRVVLGWQAGPGAVLTAEEAAAVEAPAVALHLLGVVHGPAAGAALVASSPVGHGGAAGRGVAGEKEKLVSCADCRVFRGPGSPRVRVLGTDNEICRAWCSKQGKQR